MQWGRRLRQGCQGAGGVTAPSSRGEIHSYEFHNPPWSIIMFLHKAGDPNRSSHLQGGAWWVSSRQGVSSQGPRMVPPGLGLRNEQHSVKTLGFGLFPSHPANRLSLHLYGRSWCPEQGPRGASPRGAGLAASLPPQPPALLRSSSWVCSWTPSLRLLHLRLAFYRRDRAGAALAWPRTPERLRHEY